MRHRGWHLLFLLPIASPGWGGEDGDSLTAPATAEEIASLIEDLSDPRYPVRTLATRRLCAIGRPAAPALRRAAASDHAEVALRASAVLKVIEQLLFSGTAIELAPSRRKLAWNETLDLSVKIRNPSSHPARIHFDVNPSARAAGREHVQQVCNMLDLAEWLVVIGPQGKPVNLRVDDIASDVDVHDAVLRKAQEPIEGLLPGGSTLSIDISALNRGWARYPLLDPGVYTMVFEYVPAWEDEVLAGARAGQVRSNEVQIEVTRGAPPTVSRSGVEAEISIEQTDGRLVAQLANRRDVSVHVNRNFGPVAPFAKAVWVFERPDDVRTVPVGPVFGLSWADFRKEELVRVEAGERLELAAIRIKDLRDALTGEGAALDGEAWTVHFSYTNLADRTWQRRADRHLLDASSTPDVLRRPLPHRIITSRYLSNRLRAPRAN